MPHELFGDVVSRPPSVSSRRTPLVIASIVTHVLLIAAVIVASLVVTDALPMPREALAYFEPAAITDVQLPPPPPQPRKAVMTEPAPPAVRPDAAPLVAPDGITPETRIELVTSAEPVGVVPGTGIGSDAGTGSVPGAPPPAPPPAEPVRLHSGIRAPQKIANVAPVYPHIAQITRVQGVVILEATIDVQGNVVTARVLRSIPLLDDAALEAVRQWKFTPALLNGTPVPVIMTVTVNFTLQ